MGAQLNVIDKRIELLVSKQITPTESLLLELIHLGTAAARNGKSTICSKAEFFIEDLSSDLGYKSVNKVWTLLKSLHKKNLITREPTRSKGRDIMGLNPEVFGQILIDTQHEVEKRRHLKLVPKADNPRPTPPVDKSKLRGDNFPEQHTDRVAPNTEPWGENPQSSGETHMNRGEIEHEKSPLDSSRLKIDTLRGQPGKVSLTFPGETEAGKKAREEAIAMIKSVALGGMRSMPR